MSAATPGPTDPSLPYDGRVLIVDTSAWGVVRRARGRSPQPDLVADFQRAISQEQLRVHTAVKLELLHSARTQADFVQTEATLDLLPTLAITATASDAAVGALRDLSEASTAGNPTNHRVGHGDVLVAATAAERGFGVLHYDHHFERLAPVLGFDHYWIATPGDY